MKEAIVAANWWSDQLQQGDKEAFRISLVKHIEGKLPKWGRVVLTCDYDPMGGLLDAVRDAGVECMGCMFSATGILPTKTDMIVEVGKVRVSAGYGQPYEALELS